MGALVGLGFGIGVVLLGSHFALPRRPVSGSRAGRIEALLEGAGAAGVRPRSVVTVAVLLAVAVLIAVQAASRTAPVSVAFAVIAGYLPFAALKSRVRRRQREFAEAWPEAVDHLASAVRAGLSLAEALSALASRGPERLRPAFAAFARDYQLSGRLLESLDDLKDRLADPVGDRVVEALRVAREVGGGDLGRLLRNLSGYLRDEARTRAELEARQAWTVNGARLAVAAPWMVLALLSFQHEVIARYDSAAGVLVLLGGAGCCLVAYGLMMRIGRLPAERRVFG